MSNFQSNGSIPSLMIYKCGNVIVTMIKQPLEINQQQEYDYIISVNWKLYELGIFETNQVIFSDEDIIIELFNQYNENDVLTPHLKKDFLNRYVVEKIS